jgi:hypothetical protein
LQRPASKAAGRGRLDAVARLLVSEGAVLPGCVVVVLLGAGQARSRRTVQSKEQRSSACRGKRA